MAYYNGNYNGNYRTNINKMPCQQPTVGTDCNNTNSVVNNAVQIEGDVDSYCQVLAISYVPMQKYECIYPECKAFMFGTVFPSLNKPFLGGKR